MPLSPARNRRRLRLAAGALVASAAFLATFQVFFFANNFAIVDEGRLYRCAQPRAGLPSLLADRRIASVLNLRGGSPKDDYYRDEVAAVEAAGAAFYDLPMGATRRPGRRELLAILDVLGRGPYPILIHCKSGSDRTGLADALYRLSIKGEPPEAALAGFSIWRGHVPLLGPEHLHEPIAEYAGYLKSAGLEHSPSRFRAWVEALYRDDAPAGTGPEVRPGPRSRLAGAGGRNF